MDLGSTVALLNVGAGIFSIAASVWSLALAARDRHAAERVTDDAKFAEAIQSDDMIKLGSYLDDVVGKLTVSDYTGRADIKRRVDVYLDRIVDYLNKDTAGAGLDATKSPIRAPLSGAPTSIDEVWNSSVVEDIKQSIEKGAVWNALAKLRCHIEQVLNILAIERQLDIGERKGAGFLVQRLGQAGILDELSVQELMRAIGMANRAIHGDEVTTEDARLALDVAISALSRIAKYSEC
jgi:hypothetical protein